MKIERLKLLAFGPFTDTTLDFRGNGLHIVYGPNEAGKSSALRALIALFFGIERNTKDNFLHENTAMRVGGLMCSSDGKQLNIVRRKGNRQTLLNACGDAIDDQVLTPFLHGVSKDLFGTLFGIDHQALRQGGKDILEQKGEVGQALFSAALGSHVLHDVLAGLDQEATELFTPRGQRNKINAAVREYAQVMRDMADFSLKSGEWDTQSKVLDDAIQNLQILDVQLKADRSEVNRLKRIQRVLPKLSQRQALLAELEELGEVVLLSEDFESRRLGVGKAIDEATPMVKSLREKLIQFQSRLDDTSVNQPLLTQAESIQALHARLSSYQSGLVECPKLENERQLLLAEVGSQLQQIRPDLSVQNMEDLRPVLSRKKAISEMVKQRPLLVQELTKAESDLRSEQNSQRLARENHDQSQKPASTELLRNHIRAGRREGELSQKIIATKKELSNLEAQCTTELSRLNFWSGQLEDMPSLSLPTRETIDGFDEQYLQIATRLSECEKERKKNVDVMEENAQELDEINLIGQVVTESQLLGQREQRDLLWQLLRRCWVEGDDVSAEAAMIIDSDVKLHDAFEQRLAVTDEMADRLRREADRVLNLAKLQSKQASEQEKAKRIEESIEYAEKDKLSLDERWQDLWSVFGITPGVPKAMRAWLDSFELLRGRVEQVRNLAATLKQLEQQSDRHTELLTQELEAVGYRGAPTPDLDVVLDICETTADKLDIALRERELLEQKLREFDVTVNQLRDKQQLASQALEAWTVNWKKLMSDLALSPDLQPTEMDELTENVRQMFDNQAKAEELRIKVEGLHASCEAFAGEVAELVENVAPELADKPVDQAVQSLNKMLSDNQSLCDALVQTRKDIAETKEGIAKNTAIIESNEQLLHALCLEAQCNDHQQLEELWQRFLRHTSLRKSIAANEKDVLDISDGFTLDDVQQQSKSVELDALPAEIQQLQSKIDDEMTPRRDTLLQAKIEAEAQLAQMDGSDKAAEHAETGSALLAGIRADAERYVRVKLAGKILREHIEKFRQENQGPVIKRASELFSSLTLESFAELKTDFNDRDEPVLTGIRKMDSKPVTVEGMSSGTLDQLYLALRLASLEKYMADADPMPFIVDDVLIEFDDDRAEAALQAMADMAETTQVILFTHHSRILEQSERINGSVHTHTLDDHQRVQLRLAQ